MLRSRGTHTIDSTMRHAFSNILQPANTVPEKLGAMIVDSYMRKVGQSKVNDWTANFK